MRFCRDFKKTKINRFILTYYLILPFCLLAGNARLFAQQDTIVNEYTRILSIISTDTTNIDSVIVADVTGFNGGDAVMFIQMVGFEVYSPATHSGPGAETIWGKIREDRVSSTGKYCLLLIKEIVGDSMIVFSASLPTLFDPGPGDISQLIRVSRMETVSVESGKTITCPPWDPVRGEGGIVAIVADRKLLLSGSIDVTGKGFPGGQAVPDEFGGECSVATDPYYLDAASDFSGLKGGSMVYDGFQFTRGNGFVIHAGGGGNGKYSGGGGGGSYGAGGNGGKENNKCLSPDFMGGAAGLSIKGNTGNAGFFNNRIYPGGGGGASTQNSSLGKIATPGGSGGGIIVIITDSLYSLGGSLIANGASVTDNATAGGGGGGGGGMIVLDVATYMGNTSIITRGGSGGNTGEVGDINFKAGPGGGGGGGLLWYPQSNISDSIDLDVLDGDGGRHIYSGEVRGATNGEPGGSLGDLITPIRGFTFNFLLGNQDICFGDTPRPVTASTPKGDTAFSFLWQQWTLTDDWKDAPGINNQKDYLLGPLEDTTHYRRIVTALTNNSKDTSGVVRINVLPLVTGNAILADDTVCYGEQPKPLLHDNSAVVAGGAPGNYKYEWQSMTNSTHWQRAAGATSGENYIPEALTDTTYFRRMVISHVCLDSSNTITIPVLDPVSGNTLSGDTTLCEPNPPGLMKGQTLGGGQPGDYRYNWEESYDRLVWNSVSSAETHSIPATTDTIFFRRTVYSGFHNACTHISDTVEINVHPMIKFNWLIPGDTTVCEGVLPGNIRPNASIAGGTGQGTHSYLWEQGTDQINWTPAEGTNTSAVYQPNPLALTTWYRRYVSSGTCENTSDSSRILVHSKIINNFIQNDQVLCQGDDGDSLVQMGPDVSGSIGSYSRKWQLSSPDTNSWTDIPSSDSWSFKPGFPSLDTLSNYRRLVSSGACSDTSNRIEIVIQRVIENNKIFAGKSDTATCTRVAIELLAPEGGSGMTGGNEADYIYRWEKWNSPGSTWQDAPMQPAGPDYLTDTLSEVSHYRRYVSSGECEDFSDSIRVGIHPRPTGAVLSGLGNEQCYYPPDSVRVDLSIQLSGTAPYDITFFNGEHSNTEMAYPYDTGTVIIRLGTEDSTAYMIVITSLEDGNGCVAEVLTGQAEITVFKNPDTRIEKLSDSICGEEIPLEAISDVGSGLWSPQGEIYTITPANQAIASLVLNNGYPALKDTLKFWIYWTETNGVCQNADSIYLTLYEKPEDAFAGHDSTIYFASGTRLWAAPATAGIGTWSKVSGLAALDPSDLHNPNISVDLGEDNLDTEVISLFNWEVVNGACVITDHDVEVTRRDIKTYSGFSPNDGNNLNNELVFDGLEYADQFRMHILTRQGVIIRTLEKSSGEDFSGDTMYWDGYLENGKEAVVGTYFYILEVTHAGQSYQYKGFVELARSDTP